MPQAGGVAVDADIRGRGGFSLLPGEWRKTLGIFESGDSASRRGDYHRDWRRSLRGGAPEG